MPVLPDANLPRRTPITRGQWMALIAAFLGWMFDGFEMGLFPLVARPALADLLGQSKDTDIGNWFGIVTAGFLVGAATGGVLFGWLGDRIGRVRAMMLSVFTYAVFSGLCGVAGSATQVALLRFVAALGMGGEWSLGVALVMEVWPNRSRAFLAGLIGAAANCGFLLIALIGLGLSQFLETVHGWVSAIGLPASWTDSLFAASGWRLLMIIGAAPALLTFLIRLFVPESASWQREHGKGATSHWQARDLLGVLIGALGPCAMIFVWAGRNEWAGEYELPLKIGVTIAGVLVATLGYTYPVIRYLKRLEYAERAAASQWRPTLGRMLIGAGLGGVALLGTWGSVQWATPWSDKLTGGEMPAAKAYTQIVASLGAIVGTIAAAQLGDWLGRRVTYALLCACSLASALALFQLNDQFGTMFLVSVFIAGAFTASFYGWLPLYLPELFRTRVRATGQGFSFNFGRILAAVGTLQTANLMSFFEGSYPKACTVTSLIYVVGLAIIWLAPETRGKPLPE